MAGTIGGWIAYAKLRGQTVADDPASAAALVRAQDYIQHQWVSRFAAGLDDTADGVDEATYIAAGLELASPGFFSVTTTPDQAGLYLKKVGEIEWGQDANRSTVGAVGSGNLPRNAAIEALLSGYLATPGIGTAMYVV